MGYLTFNFFVFVCIVLIMYYFAPSKYQWHILLIASLCFYLSLGIQYFPFLLFVSISTYFGAIFMQKHKNAMLVLIICANVGVWFITKILFQNVKIFQNTIWEKLIPIGISYYVLQAISYLIDIYKGNENIEKSFFKYMLFLSYFPAIIQGPISRYGELKKQLFSYKKINIDNFFYNLTLILFGITKKLVIADRIAILADYCFDNFMEIKGITLYLGALAYTIQIYTDFSGCVDICRGTSGLFSIELIQNFNSPYFSESIKEFWNRWHISLGKWLKEYIYIPLGGNKMGKTKKYINLIITFGVSGIWHGAKCNFIMWGILQAVLQIASDCTRRMRKRIKKVLAIEKGSFSEKLYKIWITFHLTMFSWIIFRSESVRFSIIYIKNMFSSVNVAMLFSEELKTIGVNLGVSIVLIVHICILIYIDFQNVKKKDVISSIRNSHILIRFCIYLIIIYDILLFGVYGRGYDVSGFLYGGF